MATDKRKALKDIVRGTGRMVSGVGRVTAGTVGAVPAWLAGGYKVSDRVVGLIPKGVGDIKSGSQLLKIRKELMKSKIRINR